MRPLWFIILIIIAVLLAFMPALQAGYIHWDDGKHIYNNPLVYGNIITSLPAIFTQHINGTYIPLTTLSFNIEHMLFGLHPWISHAINIGLHALTAILVFMLMQRLGLKIWAAFLGSLFFALHPLRVESVAWVTERKDMLCAIFYLASLLTYITYIQTKNLKHLWMVGGYGALSILAKPMGVSLPWVLLLIDWWFKRPFALALFVEKIPLALCVWAIALQTFLTLSPHPGLIFPNSILIAMWSLAFYLIKFIFPYPLLPLYIPPEPVMLSTPAYAIALGVWFALINSLILFRKNRLFVFACAWWFISIFFFARFDFADINIVADRFMYLPSIGFCALLGYGLNQLMSQQTLRPLAIGLMASLITGYGVMSFIQSSYWQNDQNLWRMVLKHEPQNSLARKKINLLLYKPNEQTFDDAKFKTMIDASPDKALAYNQRGLMLLSNGQHEMAMHDFNEAIRLQPKQAQGYINRGSLWNWLGNDTQAMADFNQAIFLEPKEPFGYINRAIVLTQQRHWDEALKDCGRALDINPHSKDAFQRRGMIWMAKHIWPYAINDFNNALLLDPNYKDAYFQRAMAFKQLNQMPQALNDLKKAINIDPSDTPTMNELGVLYIQSNDIPSAINTFNEAIALDSFNHQLYVNRANAWLKVNNFDKAVEDLTQAIALSHRPWRYLITRGDIYMTRGKFDLASKDFSQASQWENKQPLGFLKLARARYEAGDYTGALKNLNKAILIDPTDANAYLARATVYRKINRIDQAIHDEQQSQSLENPT